MVKEQIEQPNQQGQAGHAFLHSLEWQQLRERHSIRSEAELANAARIVPISQLLDEQQAMKYLQWLAEYIGAPQIQIAASMLIKRYAFLLAVPVLHAMTAYNVGIVLSHRHSLLLTIEDSQQPERTRFPDLHLSVQELSEPMPGQREVWREEVLSDLFGTHLTPLIQMLAKVGNVPPATLWENVMVRIIAAFEPPDEREVGRLEEQMQQDFTYLVREASGELFGLRKNPLAIFAEEDTLGAWVAKPMRLTCCLYHQMAPEYCRKCPKTKIC